MSRFPKTFALNLEHLPYDLMSSEGQKAIDDLQQKGFVVRHGITLEFANIVRDVASEPSIKEYCPNDSSSRFSSTEKTEEWLSKGRATFLLLKGETQEQQRLAGYGWVGSKHVEEIKEGDTTFSLRISERYQGQGLASMFSQSILDATNALYGNSKMWLETWKSNGGAVHIYHKLGFHDVTEKVDTRPTASGKMVQDTRIYMLLNDKTTAG